MPSAPLEAPRLAQKEKVVVASLPKSGTMFIQTSLAESLKIENIRIFTRAPLEQRVDPEGLLKLLASENSFSSSHLAPHPENIRMLRHAGIRKLALLARDPRDATLSYFWHLERPDIQQTSWIQLMLKGYGIIPEDYYTLSKEAKLNQLIETFYVRAQTWLHGWANVMEAKSLDILLVRFEDMIKDNRAALQSIARHFGQDTTLTLAEHANKDAGGVSLKTHFRRGEAGAYKDELSPAQVARMHALSNPEVFSYYRWPLG